MTTDYAGLGFAHDLSTVIPGPFLVPGSSLRSVKPRTERRANHLKALKAGSRALVKNKPRDDEGLGFMALGFARDLSTVILGLVPGIQLASCQTAHCPAAPIT